MRKIGIIQPNYIPWRGYFDFIQEVDVFVIFDDVRYTKGDWRNRNRIKTINGDASWLSVPTIGGRNQLIKDVKIDNSKPWIRQHLSAIKRNYGKTNYFDNYFEIISNIDSKQFDFLSDLDIYLTKRISSCLGITTEFVISSTIPNAGTKNDKLLKIVKYLEGDLYLSGPAAKAYIHHEFWEDAGVAVEYKDYSGYAEYQQISDPFEPAVSVLDLMFMVGPEAPNYIWGKNRKKL
jgi:hypothetical protein